MRTPPLSLIPPYPTQIDAAHRRHGEKRPSRKSCDDEKRKRRPRLLCGRGGWVGGASNQRSDAVMRSGSEVNFRRCSAKMSATKGIGAPSAQSPCKQAWRRQWTSPGRVPHGVRRGPEGAAAPITGASSTTPVGAVERTGSLRRRSELSASGPTTDRPDHPAADDPLCPQDVGCEGIVTDQCVRVPLLIASHPR